MPPVATRSAPAHAQRQTVAVAPIPFTAAAHEHMEPAFQPPVVAIGAGAQQQPLFNLPAYGFLAHVLVHVDMSGGTLGAGALNADWPFNVLQQIMLLDTNGAPIFGPLDGFAAYLANKWGGYGYRQDPKLDPSYDGTINGEFIIRIPVQITRHNGYGSVANQNAAAPYQVQYTLNSSANCFDTAPTTPPNVIVKAYLECWSQPNATDLLGRPQMREPVGHGTTQFWSSRSGIPVSAGQNNIPFTRVGNLIRNWIVIARNASGARADNVFPDPFIFQWDARNLHSQVSQAAWIKKMQEALHPSAVRDVGVFVFPFTNFVLGHAGDEEPNLWVPTVQSSRIELQGVSAAAGTHQQITNDIAAVEVDPAERYVETSQTGFHPTVAPVAA